MRGSDIAAMGDPTIFLLDLSFFDYKHLNRESQTREAVLNDEFGTLANAFTMIFTMISPLAFVTYLTYAGFILKALAACSLT